MTNIKNHIENYGERLKQMRQSNNYTLEQVSKKLNVHLGTISNWEKEKRLPNIPTFEKLAKIYGCNLIWLIFGDEIVLQNIKEVYIRIKEDN